MTTLKHSSRTKPLALRHPNSIQSARTRALSCTPRISQPLASWPTKEFRICLPHALRSPEIKLKFVSKTIWLDGTDACWCGNGRSRSCFCNFSFRHLKYSECVHIENKLGVSRDCARTLRNGAAALAFNYQTTCKCFCTVASETECLRVCAAIPYNWEGDEQICAHFVASMSIRTGRWAEMESEPDDDYRFVRQQNV